MTETISIVGLGKLGACMAAASAQQGFRVIGVDISPEVVACVNRGEAPVAEPGLKDLYTANATRIVATSDFDWAIENTDITFVYVNTPSLTSGAFSSEYVIKAAESVGKALSKKSAYHVVVLVSTVIPGVTQTIFKQTLERTAGKGCPERFGLCFNPEFIALGTTLKNMLLPDFVVIGQVDDRSGAILEDFYDRFCENEPPIVRTSLAEAELVKVGINSFLTLKITFANLVSQVCERIPQANPDRVTSTIGLDSRIGKKFLTGGLPYGGPCFPRDNGALGFLIAALGLDDSLLVATDKFNDGLVDLIAQRLTSLLPTGRVIGVLGLAYKPGTDVVTESPPLRLVEALAKAGYKLAVYDPMAMANAEKYLPKDTEFAASPQSLIQLSDCVVLASPCDEFRGISRWDFPTREEPIVFLDCWRMLEQDLSSADNVRYVALGVASDSVAEASLGRLTQVAGSTLTKVVSAE